MKKLLLLSIIFCGFALGSEQNQAMLSNTETAQLWANFLKLPDELQHEIIPNYCSAINALVSFKKIPNDDPNVNSRGRYSHYWKYLLYNDASGLVQSGFNDCVYNYIHEDKVYPLYINGGYHRGFQALYQPRNVIGLNKNKLILLDKYLFDLNKVSDYKPSYMDILKYLIHGDKYSLNQSQSKKLWEKFIIFDKFKDANNIGNDRFSDQAVFLDDKYLFDQNYLCLHPTQNVFISKDKNFYKPFVRVPHRYFGRMKKTLNCPLRVNITHYDSITKKFNIESISVPIELIGCVFDKSELSKETFWGIDITHKLVRFTKNNKTYGLEQFNLSHDVVSVHQSNDNSKLMLINTVSRSYLYKIQDDRRLKLIKAFEAPATFLQKDDNLSVREKYQQEHVVIIKPFSAATQFLEKQSAKALIDKLPKLLAAKTNLKQRILQSFQLNNDKNMGGM